MNVLLSVKPKYVEKILDGEKKYEFRRTIFKKSEIEKVYIYSSSPVGKITATFEIERILTDEPEKIWELCHKYAGISEKDFFSYFKNSDIAHAIKIGNICKFPFPIDPYQVIENFNPPQSYYYLYLDFFQNLRDINNTELIKPAIPEEPFSEIPFIKSL